MCFECVLICPFINGLVSYSLFFLNYSGRCWDPVNTYFRNGYLSCDLIIYKLESKDVMIIETVKISWLVSDLISVNNDL